jgi:predicted DNA-binding transcriptional regulator AlpA
MGAVKRIETKKAHRFLTRGQVAEMLGLSVKTLDRWALLGAGPRFRRLGLGHRAVRYELTDVEAFIESASVGGGDPRPAA